MSTDSTLTTPQTTPQSRQPYVGGQRIGFELRTPRVTPSYDADGRAFYRIDRINPNTKQIQSVVIYWDQLSEEERSQFVEGCIQKATIDVADLTHQVQHLRQDISKFTEETERREKIANKILANCLNSHHLKGIDIDNLKFDPTKKHADWPGVLYDPCPFKKEESSISSQGGVNNQSSSFAECCWTSIKSFFSSPGTNS